MGPVPSTKPLKLPLLTRHVSLKTSIYVAALATLGVVAFYLLLTLESQQQLAVDVHEILDTRIVAMQAAQAVKQSVVRYDDSLFRYLATRDSQQLYESREMRDVARVNIQQLSTLSHSRIVRSRLSTLKTQSEQYFSDADALIAFSQKNDLAPHAGVFRAAAWARDQPAHHHELVNLSDEGKTRLEQIFALCDELILLNRIDLETAEQHTNDLLRLNRRRAVEAGAGVGVIVLLISFGLAFSLVDRLYILLEGVRRVEAGELDIEIPVNSDDEVGELTSAFNRMTQTTRRQRDRLLQETITDSLTGAYNQRHFRRMLGQEFDRARRASQPLALLMIDIDHFKRYNDSLGHEFGNELLRKIVQLLREHLRESDTLARYGGDELSIILPNTAPEPARGIAHKLHEAVQGARFLGADALPEKRVSVSIGVSSFPEDAASANDLVQCADEALYAAKMAGRGCVRWPRFEAASAVKS